MIDVINEIHCLFHLSPKRQRFLEAILSTYRKHQKATSKTQRALQNEMDREARLSGNIPFSLRVRIYMRACHGTTRWICRDRFILGLGCWNPNQSSGIHDLSQEWRQYHNPGHPGQWSGYSEERCGMRVDFDLVWRNWFTEAEMIAADVGEEIVVPRRAKHQTHHANTLSDTARFV